MIIFFCFFCPLLSHTLKHIHMLTYTQTQGSHTHTRAQECEHTDTPNACTHTHTHTHTPTHTHTISSEQLLGKSKKKRDTPEQEKSAAEDSPSLTESSGRTCQTCDDW